MTPSDSSDSETRRLPTNTPRATLPLGCAAPAAVTVVGDSSISWTPSLPWSHPENATASRPRVSSSVNALNMPCSGSHGQPAPNVAVPSSCGDAGSVTSRT